MKYWKIFLIGAMIVSLVITVNCSKKEPTEPTNNAPNVPSSPLPSNHAIDQSIDVDLSWTGGDPDGDPVTYDVYFGTSSPPSLFSDNQSAITYDPGTLDYNARYYWKIVAEDKQGAKSEGSIWEFTTEKATYEETHFASGTYDSIIGNFYDPDPDSGAPWIALSATDTLGTMAFWTFHGLSQAVVETLVVGAWSYDDGWDLDGEEYYVYHYPDATWHYWGSSDKTIGSHFFMASGSGVEEYIRDSDGAVFLMLKSSFEDISHIKFVFCQEVGAGKR